MVKGEGQELSTGAPREVATGSPVNPLPGDHGPDAACPLAGCAQASRPRPTQFLQPVGGRRAWGGELAHTSTH